MVMASAVPVKGSSGKFASGKALELMEEVGDGSREIIIKTDQEPSIQYVVKDLVEAREEGRTVVEESPVQGSKSNGIIERAVQGLEGHMRAVLLGFEERVGVKLDPREAVVQFIPEYSAYLANRLEVGKDGKTAYERTKGKRGRFWEWSLGKSCCGN